MATRIELIRQLRQETGAGVSACRVALEQAKGQYEPALASLRDRIEAETTKRADRQTSQGRIELYSHGDGRIGVMVETNTETDFAAHSEAFQNFTHELALHIAAMAPSYVREEDIPAEVLADVERKSAAWARSQGKPVALIQKIVAGQLSKYLDEQVLLRQAYIRDGELTIARLLNTVAASVGENIVIRRFVRWELAEA